MKILVVDDEQLMLWFLRRALNKGGHDVETVSNVGEAAERLEAGDVDLLISDLRMPEGNGTELIKKAECLARRPRIIICSAFITSELEEEFRAKGICVLKKPFKLRDLARAVGGCAQETDPGEAEVRG